MELDDEVPLALSIKAFKSGRKFSSEDTDSQSHHFVPAQLPPADERVFVSEFDYSVDNHFKAVDTIAKLCGYAETRDDNQAEIERLSNSITFLSQWRDFNYKPRIVRFACQHTSEESNVIGEVTLPQFSSAAVPVKEAQNESKVGVEPGKDFVMHVGGAVWALDWCPRVDWNPENCIKSEFVAVAAHPPDSTYHKMGAVLTGRGVIQIWCFVAICVEDIPSQGNKKSRLNNDKKRTATSKELTISKRPRGRPRKNPLSDTAEKTDTDNSLHFLRPCQHVQSSLLDSPIPASCSIDSMSSENNATSVNSSNSVPVDVALPKMMLCLAHNGKVAWDVKWRPVSACYPVSRNIMGYLAVLLGSGALEVWEVPSPYAVKLVYPSSHKHIDPRFIKLQPVFRCPMLKCGDRKSIPLTVEWSVSSPHDMILAGCHDGVVAMWKFFVCDSLTESRPLVYINADTGPIRTLAWAPIQSNFDGANIIMTAGSKGFKFWDIRDPFRPLWFHNFQGTNYGLDWLPHPRCVFGSMDDGTMWFLSLERASHDIPITGKCHNVSSKHGFHSFHCSPFAIWSLQASRLTGMVAYCGEEGSTICFQPTSRSLNDPSRHRMPHYLCGSNMEDEVGSVITTPLAGSTFQRTLPDMKRSRAKEEEDVPPPPKSVAMHRVRWNVNKGGENWLCYGGASGLVRCQELDFSTFY